jgi:hypothetical protein
MAIGIFVVPTWKELINPSMPGIKCPSPMPKAIAAKIHTVR